MYELKNWWKLLGVVLMIYVITAGLLVPLKPGILSVSPNVIKAGQSTVIVADTYNDQIQDAKENRAWLKINDRISLSAKAIKTNSNNQTELVFDIPYDIPVDTNFMLASLIIDNELDGYSVLPDALSIVKRDSTDLLGYSPIEIEGIHHVKSFKFPYRNILVETIRNTFFHVAIWMAMFIILSISLFYSIKYLGTKNLQYDIYASSFAETGIVFGCIGLATGSIWARYTWGTFWTTDVKLNMSAIAMLIYIAYWILRGSINSIDSRARISAVYNIFAYFLMIPLLLILPRLTDSLHPGNGGNPALGGEDLDNTLRMVFYPAIIALALIGGWLAQLSSRVKKLDLES